MHSHRHILLITILLIFALATLPCAQESTPETPQQESSNWLADTVSPVIDQFWSLMDALRYGRSNIKPSRLRTLTETKIVGVPTVIDGDTLIIDDTRIRLWGIDAPELDQTCRYADGASYPCGSLARQKLDARINRQTLHCEHIETDVYDRKVSRCLTQSGNDIAAWMVNEGMAKAYTTYTHTYLSFENYARSIRRGFWKNGPEGFDNPTDWRTP